MIGPAPILAAIVAVFHVSAYVFIRGRAGARLPFLLIAAWLGAWAGDTVGARLGGDPLQIGEFSLVYASLVAWLGMGLVAILAVLLPERTAPRERIVVETRITRPINDGSGSRPEPGAPASIEPEPGTPR